MYGVKTANLPQVLSVYSERSRVIFQAISVHVLTVFCLMDGVGVLLPTVRTWCIPMSLPGICASLWLVACDDS